MKAAGEEEQQIAIQKTATINKYCNYSDCRQ